MSEKEKIKPLSQWQDFFSLTHDQAHPDMIDNAIRTNVRVAGTNLWVLMFAIAIASIGLNVNSTAVIIGAMLISPLMGPIVGIGYGAAVSDVKLIRLSARNLLIFIAISLFTSTLYFLITPLQQAQSELLARTTPTLWDVLIAFFGGSAGIVALTRKEISNVVPGVAIATALMPPLCTAGYGLAQGQWHYFFGAFYLFSINCVFIAFSTLVFSQLLNLPRRGLVTEKTRRFQKMVIYAVIVSVMLPSGYLAWRLVQKELFATTVNNVLQALQQEENFFILRSNLDEKHQSVRLIVSGMGDTDKISTELTKKLEKSGIHNPNIQILYAGGDEDNLKLVKEELRNSQNSTMLMQTQLQKQQEYIDTLLNQNSLKSASDEAVLKEIQVQYPEVQSISLSRGKILNTAIQHHDEQTAQKEVSNVEDVVVVVLKVSDNLLEKERKRLKSWLEQRLDNKTVELIIFQPKSN